MRARAGSLLAASLASCVSPVTTSQSVAASSDCPARAASATRYLRQLSLDLRGAPPTGSEYRDVLSRGEVTIEVIDAMLHDPRFLSRVKRWHADLLWANMGGYEISVGARLVVVPPRGQGLNVDNINPEWLVAAMDRRTSEAVCPPASDPAHLTSAACCTAANPDHPACCLVRNAAYNASDPACVAKSAALPATFSYGVSLGDRQLRGGDTYLGCDVTIEYPPPRVAASDTRWPHDASGRPYYTSPKNGSRRYYYDDRDVVLPYHSVATCPNYCRAARATGPGGTWARTDFVAKTRVIGGATVEGDGPGYACPAGYTEVENPCDNVVETRPQSRVEIRQEGWRLTRPWWADGHHVKTCAYEAQDRLDSLRVAGPCRLAERVDSSCGCGPDGAWCAPFVGDFKQPTATLARLLDALNREPLELIASVIARDEDYATIFTTRRGMANGPLAFMNRYQAEQMGELDFSASATPDALPDIPVTDTGWHEYTRSPEHSGVLTMPVFLARFPTRRARINRFWTAFLCRPFAPPANQVTPPPSDACHREDDLTRRCGCRGCHSMIEPMGAAWGRWAERGVNYLDPRLFPAHDDACASCVGAWCPSRCKHYVISPAEGPPSRFAGTLQSYLYRRPEDLARIDVGPRSLAAAAVTSGELQSCAAETAWQRLVARPMSERERAVVLPSLANHFETHGRSYRELVRAIVTSSAYRRID